jgi:competence/damage-inducible protein CinA-like protein
VRGDRRDANGPFVAAQLVGLGAEPARIVVVGDRVEDLEEAIAEGLEAEICVLSGGLGPTHDDRTIELLARIAGRPLHVDSQLAREIEDVSRGYATRLGRPYSDFAEGVRKQASIPAGAVVLGLAGTAPGVLIEHAPGRVAIALPGPPEELQRLWQSAAEAPGLRRILDRAAPRGRRLLRVFGPSESSVARALAEAGGEGSGLEVTVCARDYEIHVDLFAEEGAGARRDAVEASLRAEFGSDLFAEDARPVEEIVLALARSRGLTIATAESCTGGLVGARLTSVPGASDAYVGGIVAYSDQVKEAQLGVPGEVLERHGAVSAETAEAMAAGARHVLRADIGASVTGVAGPAGGTPEKPVGLVFLHVAAADDAETLRLELPGDRDRIRGRAAAWLLHQLRRVLSRSGELSA